MCLHTLPRGDQFTRFIPSFRTSPGCELPEWYSGKSTTYPGKTRYPSRLVVQATSYHTNRMNASPTVCQRIFCIWEKPIVDLFAVWFNNQLSSFISPYQDERAWVVDALSLNFMGFSAYLFPPIPLLTRILAKIQTNRGYSF